MKPYILNITVGKEDEADDIINKIIINRYAACCQKIKCESTYIWEGEVCQGSEYLIILKTFENLIEKIEMVCKELHSYDVHELIGVELGYANENYVKWMRKEIEKDG